MVFAAFVASRRFVVDGVVSTDTLGFLLWAGRLGLVFSPNFVADLFFNTKFQRPRIELRHARALGFSLSLGY
jgi:hypothetical protein